MIIVRKPYKFINWNINTKPVGYVLITLVWFPLKLYNATNEKAYQLSQLQHFYETNWLSINHLGFDSTETGKQKQEINLFKFRKNVYIQIDYFKQKLGIKIPFRINIIEFFIIYKSQF